MQSLLLGVTFHVVGSYSCRVNISIVSTFVNSNPIRIINVLIFVIPNKNPFIICVRQVNMNMTHLI